ncbi:MAG: hypothetical protein ACRENE_16890 [Polyangiaceae bacterium]
MTAVYDQPEHVHRGYTVGAVDYVAMPLEPSRRAGPFQGPKLPNGACSGRIVTDVVIDFYEARKRFRTREKAREPPPIQRTLALAEEFRRQLDAGGVNQAYLARRHGLTRARVTQVLNLLRLHPAILDFLRVMPPGPRAGLLTERRAGPLLQLEPTDQLNKARDLLPGFVPERTGQQTA